RRVPSTAPVAAACPPLKRRNLQSSPSPPPFCLSTDPVSPSNPSATCAPTAGAAPSTATTTPTAKAFIARSRPGPLRTCPQGPRGPGQGSSSNPGPSNHSLCLVL